MNDCAVNTSRWIAPRRPNSNTAVQLLCVPYAGGSEAVYREWQCGLPDMIEVCPVQLPGRGARIKEAPFTDLTRLVEAATPGLAAELHTRFALFGHSMGAIIAFELARRLTREYGLNPVHLFVSARCSPQTMRPPIGLNWSDAEFIELLRRSEATPDEVAKEPELLEILLPVLRADFAVGQPQTVNLEPPLECPITVFGGLEDPTTPRSCIEGWRQNTKGRFLIRMLPGGHFFINSARHLILNAIAKELQGDLRSFQLI